MICLAQFHRTWHVELARLMDREPRRTHVKGCIAHCTAGYVLYSSSTILVLTIGDGVYIFTLDSAVGEFILSHDNVKIPEEGKIYSFNEGNYGLWDEGVRKYMDSLKDADKWGGKPYSVRAAPACRSVAAAAQCA